MQNNQEQFDMSLFKSPTSRYRGAPFWAWNTKLEKEIVLEQIDQFPAMGMGGFQIHTRVGLDTEYLGTEYMEIVKLCVAKAKEQGLLCWLYDEDRWPSGYGGGLVTENHEFRSRYLVITPVKQGEGDLKPSSFDSCAAATSNGKGRFLAAFYVKLDADGFLESYHRCEEYAEEQPGSKKWYAYLEIAQDSPWFNNQAYVDTLNKKSIKRFIEVTHEKYYQAVGEEFGKTIPAIFTDEPQFPHKQFLGYAHSEQDVILPFTDDFEDTFRNEYHVSLLAHLPELLWEYSNGRASEIRYRYHNHLAERFAEAFADQIGEWCEEHGIMLCGHMMEEPTLYSQTRALGEVMRSLRSFHLPGIDMLCDQREYTTAKQAQSIAHQYNREGVISELYGVTNWDFDFRKHKLQGDWMAALGVTARVHHLSWMSMGGEAKRDYPASIGFQSPWYSKYTLIEDHFARINTAMTRGKPLIKIGVIHPVESYWLHFGPNNQTTLVKDQLETNFKNITEWLLFGLLDFDYIAESLIPSLEADGKLGEMKYDVILVPGCKTMRKTTLDFLQRLQESGKEIVFVGEIPKLVDARVSQEPEELSVNCTRIPFSKSEVLETLEPYRMLDIRYDGSKYLKKPNHKKNWDGERSDKHLYQMRFDGENQWVFIANGKAEDNNDLVLADKLLITFHGTWKVEIFNTLTGEKEQIQTIYDKGKTILKQTLYSHDSLLLHLIPEAELKSTLNQLIDSQRREAALLKEYHLLETPVEIELEEDNVLLLDMAEYRFDDGAWNEREEILRIDNRFRNLLGDPQRKAALSQPWVQKSTGQEEPHDLHLKFTVESAMSYEGAMLALENVDHTEICVNGEWIYKEKKGYYIDRSIEKCLLPPLRHGVNTIQLRIPFGRKTNVEACYLLGNFHIEINGQQSRIVPPKKSFYFGSLTNQGMPFYGGNAIYSFDMELEAGIYELQLSKYRAPLLEVYLDGKPAGDIVFSPYTLTFRIDQKGIHKIEIKSYGSRINTFGAVHNCDEKEVYFDPNAWRTENDSWSYEYQLKNTGILKSPVIRFIGL